CPANESLVAHITCVTHGDQQHCVSDLDLFKNHLMNKFLAFCSALFFCVNADATAFFYTVTGTTDNTDSATHGGSGTAGSPFQMSSLRGATIAANANPGSTIILPAATYSLTIPGDANDRQFVSFDPTKG